MKIKFSIEQWRSIGEKMGWLKLSSSTAVEEPGREDAKYPEFRKIRELKSDLERREMGEKEKEKIKNQIRIYILEIKIKKLEADKKEARHLGKPIQEILKDTKSIEDQISKMIIDIVNLKTKVKSV